MRKAKTIDEYLDASGEWRGLLEDLRGLLQDCDLEETVKWGAPCYVHDGQNVVGMAAFQNHCALWFHRGAELTDPEGVLINAQEGRTKLLRQWRLTSKKDIRRRAMNAYVREAIEVSKRPAKRSTPKKGAPAELPLELEAAFRKSKRLRESFASLTPGRQREYVAHVAEAKREATRLSRVEKIKPLIQSGVGLHDKYRNC